MLDNLNNYGVYAELATTGRMKIYTKDITKGNIDTHFFSILNLFRDGIETEQIQKTFVNVIFDNNMDIDLSIPDLFMNIIVWDLIVKCDMEIEPKHLFFNKTLTQNSIKNYIDEFFIEEKRKQLTNMQLNNMIDDMMFKFCYVDEFNGYLSNTINLEDFVDLMNKEPEFDALLHSDLTNVPIEDVKYQGMENAKKMIEYIKNSDHCLADFFNAGEGVNPKQFKEVAVNIGTKPDGRGGVYPTLINTNYLTGGVNDTLSFFIESSNGRVAQIIVEGNVGISGYFARLLGLNNLDTVINPDPDYVCDSHNFQEVFIKDENTLSKFRNRYYRLNPNGMEYLLDGKNKHTELIGQTLYLRSPMTCASHAAGHGICYRCYGDLAYTNKDINIGKIAAEEISSKLTQRMLSAKHLLESAVKKMIWSEGFKRFLDVEYDILRLKDDDSINLNGYKLLISEESIDLQERDDDEIEQSSESVSCFEILSPTGESYSIHTEEMDNMYISVELNEAIREHAVRYDDKICIDCNFLQEIPLFIVEIQNDELSTALKNIKSTLDKTKTTTSFNRHELLQELIRTFIEGGIDVMSIHGEVILSNQLRNVDNILEMPEWQYPNEPYRVLTLKQALTNNPSITISLLYEGLSKMLYNPLTYAKNKPSFVDLFFMKDISKYISNEGINKAKEDPYIEKDKRKVVSFAPEDPSNNIAE